ncbi:PIG-X-domain-containing protein [Microthyrium microscopicum]|uniref:Protein PBN1 n=1 Tax=Microthyrium microscopicum TaxID=703497 RepID=A0A6A6UDA9_9PEZI|nr:PIG-X-domain-containing protein [Microthyrium microscopicum]
MRERVTYILRNPTGVFDPKQLEVKKDSFAVDGLDAIKEHQITLGFQEITAEIWRVLRNCHELHVRWSTAQAYETVSPYVSRVTPGLHVSYTPLEGKSAKRLCTLIRQTFGQRIKCNDVTTAFTTPPILSERFAAVAARQLYYYVPSLQDFSIYLQQTICGVDRISCRIRAHDLERADTLDIDYDAVSQSLIIKALWTTATSQDDKWYETHLKGSDEHDTLEIGVLVNEVPDEEETIRFSGVLTRIGQDDKPAPTLFSTPSRHHPSKQSYTASFRTPTGLHPTLQLSFPPLTPPSETCALHAYVTLPSTLFLDRYAFTDPLFLSSHHLAAMHALSGATDLEAPEWTVETWGSAALFELAPPDNGSGFNATIPLHLRYLPPLNASTLLHPVAWPSVFWACTAEMGSKYSSSPFDRRDLGYDGLFGSNTRFEHLTPAAHAVSTLNIPVLDVRRTSKVESGTSAVILIGTLWVCWVLMRGVWRGGVGGSGGIQGQKKKGQ